MRITSTTTEGVTILEVRGEVDVETADELREAGIKALTPFGGTLRIDLSYVTFVDSTGLGALVAIRNHAGAQHTVILENPRPQLQKILAITGLDHVFETREPEAV